MKTLQASELRIGNYLNADIGIVKVESILSSIFRIYCHSIDEEYLADYKLSDLKPIPLTEDILLKCGFEIDEVFCDLCLNISEKRILGYDLKNKTIHLGQLTSHDFRDVYLGDFKYLHQLQNLIYALTNEELTINL